MRHQTRGVEWQLGLALLASFVVARRIAVRLVAKGHRQFVWVVFAPTLQLRIALGASVTPTSS